MSGQQTTVNLASAKGLPGMAADLNPQDIITAVATTTLLPGTWAELSFAADGVTLVAKAPVSASGTLGNGGIVMYFPTSDPSTLPALGSVAGITGTGYQVGEPVAILRRGRVFVHSDAATTAGSLTSWEGVKANVQHPSTAGASATNTSGYFTAVATNTTAGTETTAAPGVTFVRVAASGLAIVDVNAPLSA